MRYPRFRYFNEHGWLRASDTLLMCFYMRQTHAHIAPAVMHALELLRERIRPHRLDSYIDPDGQMHPLDDSRWKLIREEMLGPDSGVVLQLSGTGEGGGFYVDYRGLRIPSPWPGREHDASVLYLRLPTEYLEEQGPQRIHALALELAAQLPFNSGYVDFAFFEEGRVPEAVDLVHTRYPGVHLADGPDIQMNTWVDGVHWMNFLGQPVLGELGGVEALRERLALPGISLQELSGDRVLITLGEQPEVGDVEAGQTLPLHRALARVLEPHLHHRTVLCGNIRQEELLRWERRFLD